MKKLLTLFIILVLSSCEKQEVSTEIEKLKVGYIQLEFQYLDNTSETTKILSLQ